eukprot:1347407-Amphidinium_carterae.1
MQVCGTRAGHCGGHDAASIAETGRILKINVHSAYQTAAGLLRVAIAWEKMPAHRELGHPYDAALRYTKAGALKGRTT